MAEFPALPLFTDAYLADTRHLSTEEHGAYLLLMIEAWRRPDCNLPDDDTLLARLSGLPSARWAEVKPIVMAFWIRDGRRKSWTQKRLLKERAFVAQKSASQRDKAVKRWEPRQKHDATAMPNECPADAPTPTPTQVREEIGKPISRQTENHDACIDHFNAVAARVGWAQVQKITPTRKAALSHRITDCGGQEAWRDAIDRAAASPLLTGQTGRGWRADFDWLCKAANFTKLMEGNYDPRPDRATGAPSQSGKRPDAAIEQIARLTGLGATSGHGGDGAGGSRQEDGPLRMGARPQ